MTYGKTWHEGRAIRHHNLLAATQPPITGPIDKGKGRSNTAGKGHGKPKSALSLQGAFTVIQSGGTGAMAFGSGSEVYDNGNWHNTSVNNDRFTAPRAYTVRLTGQATQSSAESSISQRLDGATFAGMGESFTDTPTALSDPSSNATSALIDVTAGQYLSLLAGDGFEADFDNWAQVEVVDASLKGCLLTNTTNQALTDSVNVTLDWDTEEYDENGYHEGVTNPERITIPEDGVYTITANVATNGSPTRLFAIQRLNGASFIGQGAQDSGYGGGTGTGISINMVSAPVALSAGDYITLDVLVGGVGISALAGDRTWLSVEKVDPTVNRCFVRRNANLSISAATDTLVTFDTEVYDTAGMWAVGDPTKVFVPAGSRYARARFMLNGATTTGTFAGRVDFGGSTFEGAPRSGTDSAGVDLVGGMGAWIPVTGDGTEYFELIVYSNLARTVTGGNAVWLVVEAK